VRFIVRAREHDLAYQVLRTLSPPRRIADKQLERDGWVRLGGPHAKTHPQVRLIIARLASGERLILATERLKWSAERVLAAYRQRWHIERFHRFLKDTLGLAHLYSFEQSGIAFLLLVALLLALLLVLGASEPHGETIGTLYAMIRAVREALGLDTPWKRNTYARRRTKSRRLRSRKTFKR
jgi:IS4 transposase